MTRVATAALAVACIALSAVLLGRAFRKHDAPVVAPVSPAPEEKGLVSERSAPAAAASAAPPDAPAEHPRASDRNRPAAHRPVRLPPVSVPNDSTAPSRVPPAPEPAPAPNAPRQAEAAVPPAPSVAPPARPLDPPRDKTAAQTDETNAEKDPESDRTPPSLESLRFDPPEVEDGGASTLLIQSRDDLSGLKMAWGTVRSPSGAANLPFGPQDPGDSGTSAFKIPIPRDAETGIWYVANLSLIDRVGNTLTQSFSPATAPPGATLRVVSVGSDSSPPEVLRIWMDNPIVNGGENVLLHVEARDDRSGVASIAGFFQSPSKAAQIWFACAPKADSGFWDGEVRIPLNADCGNWTLGQLKIVDKAGNVAFPPNPSSLVAGGGFQVSSEADCDSSPPTIDAFALSPTVVWNETAAEIVVTATVSDVGSGAVSLSGWFEGPIATSGQAPRNNFACTPNPNDPNAPWTGKIVVPQFAAKGAWKVGGISVQDKARNFRHYTAADPVFSGVVFEVR